VEPRARILVVDDCGDQAESLGTLLRAMGHDARVATGGFEALEIATTFEPEVVLLDLGMPEMDGYEVARRIRDQAWANDVLIVAVTGQARQDVPRSDEAGFDLHLVKPVVRDALSSLLRHRRSTLGNLSHG
jgi:CheY-like chemotaxis protein